MREYEAMIITKLDVPENELAKMTARWETVITENGGEIIKGDDWGTRRLAYPIQNLTRAHYFVYDFATNTDNIKQLEHVLKYDENILRSLIIKLDDNVDINQRKIDLQKRAEEIARREIETNRERVEQ